MSGVFGAVSPLPLENRNSVPLSDLPSGLASGRPAAVVTGIERFGLGSSGTIGLAAEVGVPEWVAAPLRSAPTRLSSGNPVPPEVAGEEAGGRAVPAATLVLINAAGIAAGDD